jgi:hypothetical protein
MTKFLLGLIVGIYVSQEYKDVVPDIRNIVNGVWKDLSKKFDEYNKTDGKKN